MSQAVPVRSAGADGAAWWRSSSKAALAGGVVRAASCPVKLRRVKRGTTGFSHGEWARLLSRLRAGATETNDYPGLRRIAERNRMCWVSYVLASLTLGPWSPRPEAGTRAAPPFRAPSVAHVLRIACDVPIPESETRRGQLAGIVIGGMVKITRRWSRNDPCGSCGGNGPCVALLLRGSADPLSNGGGRGGRPSRSTCPRQRGA